MTFERLGEIEIGIEIEIAKRENDGRIGNKIGKEKRSQRGHGTFRILGLTCREIDAPRM